MTYDRFIPAEEGPEGVEAAIEEAASVLAVNTAEDAVEYEVVSSVDIDTGNGWQDAVNVSCTYESVSTQGAWVDTRCKKAIASAMANLEFSEGEILLRFN